MADFFQAIKNHPTIWQALKLGFVAIVTIIVLTFVLRIERRLARKLLDRTNNINVRYIESIIRFVLILIGVIWVVMSSPLTQPFGRIVFQGTAIIGAIVGFAAQPVIADLICGLMISTTQPFNIGDRIELEDGTAGVVKDITMRHVVVQTIDTLCVVIPNSKLNAMRVTNMSFHTKTRSIHFRFNISYDSDVDSAKRIILRAVEDSPYTIPRNAETGYGPVYFLQASDSSLVMAVTVYFNPVTPSEIVRDDINTRVKSALDAGGIEIPYQYVNVVMKRDGGAAQ